MASKLNLDLHSHIAAMVEAFRVAGYRVELSHDPAVYLETAKGISGYNLTSPLDTAFVDIAARFLVLRVYEISSGKLVAIETGRSLRAPRWRGGLNRILRDRSFFGTKQKVLPIIEQMPKINLSGDLCYMGGAWVLPDLRAHGIMSLLAKLTMAHLMRCFRLDHIFGLVREKHAGLAIMPDGYSFTTATQVRWAYWSTSAAPEHLFLISVDRDSLVERYMHPPQYLLKKPGS